MPSISFSYNRCYGVLYSKLQHVSFVPMLVAAVGASVTRSGTKRERCHLDSMKHAMYYFWVAMTTCLMMACRRTEQYCSSEKLALECTSRSIIIIQSALYGRMTAGKCVTSTYAESMGCHSDVTSQLEWRCSGRQNCSMLVATFDSITQPCPRDFKSYLEITYQCVTGSKNNFIVSRTE